MSNSIKVAGTWKTLKSVSLNTGGTWRGSTAAFIKVGGIWKQWYTGLILDTFTRSGVNLGTSDTGASWNILRGSWYTNGSSAQSDDSASTYPIAVVPLGISDATVSATVTAGTGPVFWAVDQDNWWAAVLYETQSSYTYSYTYSCTICAACVTCKTCTQPAGTYPSCNCGTTTTTTCTNCSGYRSGTVGCFGGCCYPTATPGNYLGPYNGGCSNTYSCTACSGTVTSCSICGSTTGGPCSCPYTSTCSGSATGYTTNYFLRVIKSVAGTVTVEGSDTSLASLPAAIKVTTLSGGITIQPYSDTALTSALGSPITLTPSSPNQGTNYGIVKSPSAYEQGATVDNFTVQP